MKISLQLFASLQYDLLV